MKMKILIILLIIYGTEWRIKLMVHSQRAHKTPQNINGHEMEKQVIPIVNEQIVFDTPSVDEEGLQLLLQKTNELDDSLSDFESTDVWTARGGPFQETAHSNTQNVKKGPEPLINTSTKNLAGFAFENGWIQYKYEKAFILVNRTVNRKEAEQICHSFNEKTDIGAELAVPQSEEEQIFLNHYMFKMSKCLRNIWIGQNTDNYRNSSHKFTLYANWAKGMPTLTKPCVQIRSPYTIYADMDGSFGGKWEDVSCHRKNLVLCQRPQHWSEHQFIRVLNELKKDVEDFKRKSGVDTIPPGFIYVQLPKQATPKSMWPMYEWKDISTLYSGLFFRVLGGKSANFGVVQEQTSPRLIGFKSYGIHGVPHEDLTTHALKADNKWSKADQNANGFPVSFRVSDEEVVPRNTAVRVWKRL